MSATTISNTVATIMRPLVTGANALSPAIYLFIRLWMANIFWKSGLAKIADYSHTLELFKDEFKVPVFSPPVAAFLATSAELICPILLVLGLATRLSSVVLIFVTFMAAISYHTGIPDAAITWGEGYLSHIYFAMLLAVLLFHGPGKLSIDYFISKRYMRNDAGY